MVFTWMKMIWAGIRRNNIRVQQRRELLDQIEGMSTAVVFREHISASFIRKLLGYDRNTFFPMYRRWVQRNIGVVLHKYSRPEDRNRALVTSRRRFLREVSNAL